MSRDNIVDLDAQYHFFDPHPGFAGATIPIPEAVRKIADDLAGRRLTMRQALRRLRAPGIGTIEVDSDGCWIRLKLTGGPDGPTHVFRVIRYC